jgi:hypothetical protein
MKKGISGKKWLNVNEELVYRKHKWENKVRKFSKL